VPPCPGRGAASFTLLRRAGTHTFVVEAWTPDQQRITSCCAASGERGRVRRSRITRRRQSSRAHVHRVPDAAYNRPRGTRIELTRQIAPVRVELLDQSDLPCAAPPLQGMLSRARFKDGIERFEIDESIDFVFACETGNSFGLMLRQTPCEIVGDADIQRPVWLTRENVDKERRVHCLSGPGSAVKFGH
jgi:hypothetical protein